SVISTLSLHDALPIFALYYSFGERITHKLTVIWMNAFVTAGAGHLERFWLETEDPKYFVRPMHDIFICVVRIIDLELPATDLARSEEHTSELQSRFDL